jgi:hypothetical protein
VGKVLDRHLNVKGSIPTPAVIFLHAFYGTNALPPPSRGSESEREREKITLIYEYFPLPNIMKIKIKMD